jgi:sugar lactone lactonase YvrE
MSVLRRVVRLFGGAPAKFTVPNTGLRCRGNLYVSNSGTWDGGNGSVQRIAPDGSACGWRAAAFTNGMALSPDGRFSTWSNQPAADLADRHRADGTAGA